MKRTFIKWAYGLGAGIVGGTASALASTIGLGAAQALGLPVHALDFNQLAGVALFGVISNGVLYLRQSPLPPLTSDTDYFEKWKAEKAAADAAKAP